MHASLLISAEIEIAARILSTQTETHLSKGNTQPKEGCHCKAEDPIGGSTSNLTRSRLFGRQIFEAQATQEEDQAEQCEHHIRHSGSLTMRTPDRLIYISRSETAMRTRSACLHLAKLVRHK